MAAQISAASTRPGNRMSDPRSTRTRARTLLAGVIGLAVLAGCGGGEDTRPAANTAPHPNRSASAAPLPKPTGKTILTISGAVSAADGMDRIAVDMAALSTLPSVTKTIYEPFDKKDVTFTGVYLSDVLRGAGIGADAKTLKIHALDDYQVEFKVSDMLSQPVILATKADGAAIPVKTGGPIRIVFPPNAPAGANRDVWIWSIDTMTVL